MGNHELTPMPTLGGTIADYPVKRINSRVLRLSTLSVVRLCEPGVNGGDSYQIKPCATSRQHGMAKVSSRLEWVGLSGELYDESCDPAPYSFAGQSPDGGSLGGPSGIILPLGFTASSNNAVSYSFQSGAMTSLAALDTICPDGAYTFPDGAAVTLSGGVYPVTTQVVSVNGRTPVWDVRGNLAINPALDNTIVWSPVSIDNFSANGHESV